MRHPALATLSTLAFAACESATLTDLRLPLEPPRFATTINVPGDFPSIQAAHDAATSGDTILVAPGTYVGRITITKAITLSSHFLPTGDEGYITATILDGGGGSAVIEIPSGAEPGATIQGVTIQNASDGISPHAHFDLLNCLIRDTGDGVDYENASGGLVRFCTFELNSDDGLDLDNAVALVIADNVIRNNGDDGIEIRMQSYTGPLLNIIVTRNEIYGNGEDGIQLIHYGARTDRYFEITHNYIYDNVDAGIGMMDQGATSEDFRAASIPEIIYIFNNTFARNSHGITGGDSSVVLNNIFADHPVIAVKSVDAGSELAFNLFFNNGADNDASNVDAGSSVLADPLFAANLALEPGSPAIDAGTARYVWQGRTVLDLAAAAYAGAAPDLGAFESQPAGTPPDPPQLVAPLDGAVDVSLTPTLSWVGGGDGYAVQVATDPAFVSLVDAAVVSTTEYTVASGALSHLTTYYWRVTASNAFGTSGFSAQRSFTTAAALLPPDPPILVSPADGAQGVSLAPALEWTGAADDFDVEVASDGGFGAVVFATSTTAHTSMIPPGTLRNDTEYFWRVRGNNGAGAGAFSTIFTFRTLVPPDVEPPSQPANLRSPARTTTTIDLLWDPSSDDVGVSVYHVFRDDVLVASETDASHTAGGLTPATSYAFRVTAVDAAGNESAPSAVLVVTTEASPARRLHVRGMAMQRLGRESWSLARAAIDVVDDGDQPIDDALVVVEWSGLTTGVESGVTGGGLARFDSDKVSDAGRFTITVTDVALDGFLYDAASNVVTAACIDTRGHVCSVGPDVEPPAAPADLTAIAAPGAVSLDWDDNTEIDWASYSVYRSITAGSGRTLLAAGVAGSQFTDSNVAAGTMYHYVVTAKDQTGNESAWSNEASATALDPALFSIHVLDITLVIARRGEMALARATVAVVDQDGNAAPGATVDGFWTLNSTNGGAGSGVTGGDGVTVFASTKEHASSGDVFTFTVTALRLTGYVYDAAGNVKTTASVTVP